MAVSNDIPQEQARDLLTLIRQKLPQDQWPTFDGLGDDDKELLVIHAHDDGVEWVITHWEYLKDQIECYKDF